MKQCLLRESFPTRCPASPDRKAGSGSAEDGVQLVRLPSQSFAYNRAYMMTSIGQ
jgi:hypothetical protein